MTSTNSSSKVFKSSSTKKTEVIGPMQEAFLEMWEQEMENLRAYASKRGYSQDSVKVTLGNLTLAEACLSILALAEQLEKSERGSARLNLSALNGTASSMRGVNIIAMCRKLLRIAEAARASGDAYERLFDIVVRPRRDSDNKIMRTTFSLPPQMYSLDILEIVNPTKPLIHAPVSYVRWVVYTLMEMFQHGVRPDKWCGSSATFRVQTGTDRNGKPIFTWKATPEFIEHISTPLFEVLMEFAELDDTLQCVRDVRAVAYEVGKQEYVAFKQGQQERAKQIAEQKAEDAKLAKQLFSKPSAPRERDASKFVPASKKSTIASWGKTNPVTGSAGYANTTSVGDEFGPVLGQEESYVPPPSVEEDEKHLSDADDVVDNGSVSGSEDESDFDTDTDAESVEAASAPAGATQGSDVADDMKIMAEMLSTGTRRPRRENAKPQPRLNRHVDADGFEEVKSKDTLRAERESIRGLATQVKQTREYVRKEPTYNGFAGASKPKKQQKKPQDVQAGGFKSVLEASARYIPGDNTSRPVDPEPVEQEQDVVPAPAPAPAPSTHRPTKGRGRRD
jgi:hypothetical protein